MPCPNCNNTTCCEAIRISERERARESRGLFYSADHKDIRWIRRGRMCRYCFYRFVTADVSEAFLNELVRLRSETSSSGEGFRVVEKLRDLGILAGEEQASE